MRMVRRNHILIKADNAEEAAAMATRVGATSCDNLDLYVEVAPNSASQSDKCVKVRKKHKTRKQKSFWVSDDEIPF